MRGAAAALLSATAAVALPTAYDDFHYPAEEPAQRAALRTPAAVSVAAASCELRDGSATQTAAVGGTAFGWRVTGLLPNRNPPTVALEQDFDRWGVIALVAVGRPAVTLRKSVGSLDKIHQPYFNLSGDDPNYFGIMRNSLEDYPSQLARNMTSDGEVDYPSLAATLAPQRDIAEVSNNHDVAKFVVTYNGRVKCASYSSNGTMNGITDYADLHAAPPNPQTVVFDPADHLQYWPQRFEHSKAGHVGGHLHIANVAGFSAAAGGGFDLVAFSPVAAADAPAPPAPAPAPAPCAFDGPLNDTYIKGCSAGCQKHASLADAQAACEREPSCGGVTLYNGQYDLRAGSSALPSPKGEVSWLLNDAAACHGSSAPRLPGLNYRPGVLVRLREQAGATFGEYRYFYASNDTLRGSDATEFYAALADYHAFYDDALAGAMQVTLPDSDRRQADMAVGGLLGAWGNYVGNQSNYGNGATYWSYAREDNGSLPLNVLSVEDGMLEWGVCGPSLAHVGFYFDNYVRPDGSINYYTWGGSGDSVGDTGRLASLYLKALRLCGDAAWGARYLGTAELFGALMLRERRAAAAAAAPAYATGLLKGAPEHDWSSTKDKYFYNNNVWVLRGMEELGSFLTASAGPAGRNATLGSLLLADAAAFRGAISASVSACLVKTDKAPGWFLPPYAELGATPFTTMTATRESEYSNFRFFSETLLADVLPREVEDALLGWHNDMGGRLGGASRFSAWLDDMPTAGWGYGALTNNRTQDFLALLYGHMATYQSRGTFHSTEQLSFSGEGWYRNFNHWPNPPPNGTAAVAPLSAPLYYGNENDVSYCIVTQVLAARLTRWQLVLEDTYRGGGSGVWLARGAPRRWFAAGAGFNVSGAPTTHGRLSYSVTVPSPGSAAFHVDTPAAGVVYRVRWPGEVSGAVQCDGCTVVAPPSSGVAAVVSAGGAFTATARWA